MCSVPLSTGYLVRCGFEFVFHERTLLELADFTSLLINKGTPESGRIDARVLLIRQLVLTAEYPASGFENHFLC
jgi:hypothetical protein